MRERKKISLDIGQKSFQKYTNSTTVKDREGGDKERECERTPKPNDGIPEEKKEKIIRKKVEKKLNLNIPI